MEKEAKTINAELAEFWNKAMTLTEEGKAEIAEKKGDPHRLAPSPKLAEAYASLSRCEKILDYGCGHGWASIIAASSGAKSITAVDLGSDIIDAAKYIAGVYGVSQAISFQQIAPDWISSVPSGTYDAIMCSNVLDVITLDVCDYLIAQFARVAKQGASVVIGLNFYMSPEAAKQRGHELIGGHYLMQDGILRLTSLTDEGWEKRFSPYFEVIKLDHFAWPWEQAETRRLFFLRKKAS